MPASKAPVKWGASPPERLLRPFAAICEAIDRAGEQSRLLKDLAPSLETRLTAAQASLRLKQLEAFYSFHPGHLIKRGHHKGCEITAAGRTLYWRVRELLDKADALAHWSETATHELITVAASHAVAANAVTRIVAAFKEEGETEEVLRNPKGRVPAANVDFHVREVGDPVAALNAVRNRDASVAITISDIADVRFVDSVEIKTFEVRDVLLLPRRTTSPAFRKLRSKPEVSLADLEHLPLSVPDALGPKVPELSRLLKPSGRGARAWADSLETVASFVATGHYAGVGAYWPTAYGKWRDKVVTKPVKELKPYFLKICTLYTPPPTPTVKAFVECAAKCLESMAGEFSET